MNGYYCNSCKEFFDEPIKKRGESCGVDFEYGAEEFPAYYVCPHCGSPDITSPDQCELCGEESQPGKICTSCYEAVAMAAEAAVKKIMSDIGCKRDAAVECLGDYIENDL